MGLFSSGSSGPSQAVLDQGFLQYYDTQLDSWQDRMRRAEEEARKSRAMLALGHLFGGNEGFTLGDMTGTPEIDRWYENGAPAEIPVNLGPLSYNTGSPYHDPTIAAWTQNPEWEAHMRGRAGEVPQYLLGEVDAPSGLAEAFPEGWRNNQNIKTLVESMYQPHVAGYEAETARAKAQAEGIEADPEMFAGVGAAVAERAGQDLDEQHADAAKRMRFGLARRGLAGSSMAVQAAERIARRLTDARGRIRGMADDATESARQGHENLRAQLVAAVHSGVPTSEVLARARTGIGSNLSAALARADQAAIGDAFRGIGDTLAIGPSVHHWQQARRGGGWSPAGPAGSGFGGSVT